MPAHADELIHKYEGTQMEIMLNFEESMISGATSAAGSAEPGMEGLETKHGEHLCHLHDLPPYARNPGALTASSYNCDFLWIAFQESASHERVLFPIRRTRGNVKDSQPRIFVIRMLMQNQT
jgi:hypothetical protein